MKVELLDEAREDLRVAGRFYELQSAGLGTAFLRSLIVDIERLEADAGIYPYHFGYQRLLSRRFPYAIYYRVEAGVARVYAILDCRRDPGWIQERLG
jgi:plasmid stabilization system protein ParE